MIARIAVLLMAAVPLTAQEKNVEDFLPLAVGNSWTYLHLHTDYRQNADGTYVYPTGNSPAVEFTISILRTEVIDGETYYVFSEAPNNLPTDLPKYFIAGKKLRWDGNNLTEHDGTSSFSLYQFDTPPRQSSSWREYAISAHGDTLARTRPGISRGRMTRQEFDFRGYTGWMSQDGWNPPEVDGGYSFGRGTEFLEKLGVKWTMEAIGEGGDSTVYVNEVLLQWATLYTSSTSDGRTRSPDSNTKGVTIEWEDYYCASAGHENCNYPPSSTSSTSWGQIKEGSYR